jgi:YD repeat-containing protein
MTISYDREVDALYIRFKGTTVTTKHLEEGVALEYDADGHLAGIDILDALKRIGDASAFDRITVEGIHHFGA